MRHLLIASTLLLTFTSAATAHDNWCGYDFTQIGVPDKMGDVDGTTLLDINNRGLIIGLSNDSNPRTGYLLRGGIFREILYIPGSSITQPRGINNQGEVVGSAHIQTTTSLRRDAFYRDAAGRYRTFAVPNAILTDAWGISNSGHIVGSYRDSTGATHGFLRKNNGQFQTIDSPFAERTLLVGINRTNTIVGTSVDNAGVNEYSFKLSNGVFELVEVPGAFATLVSDINDRGQIAGQYVEGDPTPANAQVVTRSFVLEDNHIVLIDAPFPNARHTSVRGINNKGELVGDVVFSDGHRVGFVAVPRDCSTVVAAQ